MPKKHQARDPALLLTLAAIGMLGCETADHRLVEYAQRATEQQVRQNERIAQQSETVAHQSLELASATHQLVEQDAAARRELIRAQNQLQQQNQVERSALNRQREKLAAEEKTALAAATRDPVIAQAIITAGLFLASLLPLLVTVYALRRLPVQAPLDEVLTESLLDQLVAGQLSLLGTGLEPPLLPGQTALQSDDSDQPPTNGDCSQP